MTTITYAASTPSISARRCNPGIDVGLVDRVSTAVLSQGGAT